MMRELVKVPEVEIPLVRSLIDLWGYPRPVTDDEVWRSVFYRFGPGILLWFNYHAEEEATMHLVVENSLRARHMASRGLMKAVDDLAKEEMLERLLAADCAGRDVVSDYLLRTGWRKTVFENSDEWFERVYDGSM